jgi:hypothetical protein
MEKEIQRLVERDLVSAEETQAASAADTIEPGVDAVDVDGIRRLALESEQYRAIRAMTTLP